MKGHSESSTWGDAQVNPSQFPGAFPTPWANLSPVTPQAPAFCPRLYSRVQTQHLVTTFWASIKCSAYTPRVARIGFWCPSPNSLILSHCWERGNE